MNSPALFRTIFVLFFAVAFMPAFGCTGDPADSKTDIDKIISQVEFEDLQLALAGNQAQSSPSFVYDMFHQMVLSKVSGRFTQEETGDFFDRPFPFELTKTADGHVRFTDFPNPKNSMLLRRYLELGQRDTTEFGADSGIWFAFNGPLDPASLPASISDTVDPEASVFLVGIDPDSPDYGRRYPLKIKYNDKATVYAPAYFLMALPYQGVPVLHGRTYAAVVTRDVLDRKGRPLRINPDLYRALNGNSPQAELNAVFAPLTDYLDYIGMDADEIALATVFKTQQPLDRMIAMREHLTTVDLPGIDPESIFFQQDKGDYFFLEGQVTIPIYQKGDPPYLFAGGSIEFDSGGDPILQRLESTRMSFTIPKGAMPANGWPMLVYSHGSGGSYKSYINQGVARWLALKGIAAVSIDAPHHGPRNPISDDSTFEAFCFYNATNPESFRDNNVQAAVELMAVEWQALDLAIPGDVIETEKETAPPIFFDANNVFFMGHSQGSTVGPLIVAVDPYISAAYFSGAGASLLWNILTKELPVSIRQVAQLGLHLNYDEAQEELNEFQPALNILQHMAEMVDTLSFNPYFFEHPVPGTFPKHVMQAQGPTDHYVGINSQGAFAASAYMDMILPKIHPDAWERIYWTSGLELDDTGVSGNRVAYDDTPITAAAMQYDQPPSGADGHYVTFQYPTMHRRVACFFATAIDGQTPLIVDDSGDETSPCVMEK